MQPESAKPREFIATRAAVDRILRSADLVLLPVLRDRFRACLQVCLNWYGDAAHFNGNPAQQDVADFAHGAAEATERLLRLLERGNIPPRLTSYPDFAGPLSELLPALKKFREIAKRLTIVRSYTRPASGLELDHLIDWYIYTEHFRERTAFEWLAGVYLCELYELFLGHPSGRKFIRFVETVLEVFRIKTPNGRQYSKETISKARRLSDQLATISKKPAKSRRPRPLVDANVPDQMNWLRHMQLEGAMGLHLGDDFGEARVKLMKKLSAKA